MIKTFTNFTEFYNFVLQNETIFANNAHLTGFKKTIALMNSDCPCRKKQHLAVVEELYSNMGNYMTTPERLTMKQVLGAAQVQLQHNGSVFLIF